MIDFNHLLEDPRPDLFDTRLWERIFRIIPTLPDKTRAEILHRELWGFRSEGAFLKRQAGGSFLLWADFGPRCGFDTEEEFEEMKNKILKPYAPELHQVMRKVDGYD